MRLPVPNREEALEFRTLYKEAFNVTLTEEQALDAATRIVQLVCLLGDEIHSIHKEEQ